MKVELDIKNKKLVILDEISFFDLQELLSNIPEGHKYVISIREEEVKINPIEPFYPTTSPPWVINYTYTTTTITAK